MEWYKPTSDTTGRLLKIEVCLAKPGFREFVAPDFSVTTSLLAPARVYTVIASVVYASIALAEVVDVGVHFGRLRLERREGLLIPHVFDHECVRFRVRVEAQGRVVNIVTGKAERHAEFR